MDRLAAEVGSRAHFLFVYVREAHPDDFPDHPAHTSLEQKMRHAADLFERYRTPRTILVDGLDGDVHRAYGGRPNMSWIVDHTGRVSYKADWTSARDIGAALGDTLRIRELKRDRGYKDYYRETMSVLSKEPPDHGT